MQQNYHKENKQMIEILKQSPFYDYLFKENNSILFACFTGSRLNGTIDERSDYDILCICKNASQKHNTYVLTYNGIKIHSYYQSLDYLLDNTVDKQMLDWLSLIYFVFITKDEILFVNDKACLDNLIANKFENAKQACFTFIKNWKNFILDIIKDNKIESKNRTKMIYHLCYAYYIYTNTTPDLEFLTKIKRIRWQEIDQKYIDKAIDIIKKLNNLIN